MIITAKLEWNLQAGESFLKGHYSRTHNWCFDGGATLPVSSSPGIVPIPMSNPALIDPEEAFIAAIASCHMLFFLSIAAKKRFVIEHYADEPDGEIGELAGTTCLKAITLRPEIRFGGPKIPSYQTIVKLHALAHSQCFLENSTTATININPR